MRRRKPKSWTVVSRPWRRAAGVLIQIAIAVPQNGEGHRRGRVAAPAMPLYRPQRDSGRWDQGPGRWRRVAGTVVEHSAPRLKLSPATILALWAMGLSAVFIAACLLFLIGVGIAGALGRS